MSAPANLVHETSISIGTGNFTLTAQNGKQRFSTAFGTGATPDVFDYFISNQDAAEWERGTGHMSATGTLVRDTVVESTNANAAVSFSAGTKDVTNDVPAASQLIKTGLSGGQTITGGTDASDTLSLSSTSNATKGTIIFGNATTGLFFDETQERVSLGADDQNISIGGSNTGVDLTIHNNEASEVCQAVIRYAASATRSACWFGARARGDIGTEAIVHADDRLVNIEALGYDGSTFQIAGQILCEVDGTPGAGDMPGRWIFLTTPDGSATPVEAMRINSDQSVQFSSVARPDTDDGASLGTATVSWSDVFIASTGSINWANGDVTITHSSNALAFAGASSGYTFDAALSIGTTNALTAGSIELGEASDTTLSRASAGDINIEGNIAYRAGGTDVPVADGGTGRSSATAYAVICGGTSSTGAHQSIASVGTSGQVLTSNGAGALPTFQTSGASAGVILLNSGTVSSAATLDVVLSSFTSYKTLQFILEGFIPATDDTELWMRFSTDGGSSYDTTGYRYAANGTFDNVTTAAIGSTSESKIVIAGYSSSTFAVSNTSTEGGTDVIVTLFGRTTSRFGRVLYSTGFTSSNGQTVTQYGQGTRATAQDTDAVRFLFESGNISSGNWALYGYA